MDLIKELQRNNIFLSVFDKSYYNESIYEVLKQLDEKRVCYVSLNKTALDLQHGFKFHRINTNKVFFIDAVSKGMNFNKNNQDNTLFISSPGAFNEIGIAVTEALNSGVFDVLVFDSLSTLKIYEKGKGSERFTSFLINKVKSKGKSGIFTCLEEDLDSQLIQNSCLSVDKVLKFNYLYNSLRKRKLHLAASSIVALSALFSLSFINTNTGSQVTGLVVNSSQITSIGFSIFQGIFSLSLITIVGLVVYKKILHKPLDHNDLTNIKPSNASPTDLRKKFRNKIDNWFNKTKTFILS
ncbi:MAG: hypothetical protein ABIH82_01765 [Candidatus Woesearchaeota archaeon]